MLAQSSVEVLAASGGGNRSWSDVMGPGGFEVGGASSRGLNETSTWFPEGAEYDIGTGVMPWAAMSPGCLSTPLPLPPPPQKEVYTSS